MARALLRKSKITVHVADAEDFQDLLLKAQEWVESRENVREAKRSSGKKFEKAQELMFLEDGCANELERSIHALVGSFPR